MESTNTHKDIVIAIDGFSSCGKSTLAKDLAQHLNYTYIDSGAMYRGVAVYFLENGIDFEKENDVSRHLSKIKLSFRRNNAKNCLYLNDKLIDEEIRLPEISAIVSPVAALPVVREFLQKQQREYGSAGGGIVMDGRDIGTVIFPDAQLKIFLTASQDVRTERRYQELLQKGLEITRQEVSDNLQLRDRIDSTRTHSPLKQANDAVVLDNSTLSKKEQLDWIVDQLSRITDNQGK